LLEPGTSLTLDWWIKPDDGTSSFMELWLRPQGGKDSERMGFEVRLQPPGGLPAARVHLPPIAAGGPNSVVQTLVEGGHTLATAGVHRRAANGRFPMALLTAAPTAAYGPWQHTAPSGRWKVTIQLLGDKPAYCNAYVQRDDTALGRRGKGRQGLLDDGLYQRYGERGQRLLRDPTVGESGEAVAYVRRVGTINGLATGKKVRVAGGLVRLARDDDWAVAERYSAVAIPATPLPTQQERMLALTEDSAVLHGVLAAGSTSGSRVSVSGTSMAAPQFTRAMANWWLRNGVAALSMQGVEDTNLTKRPRLMPAPELEKRSIRRRGHRQA
jgi:hypothetical protein